MSFDYRIAIPSYDRPEAVRTKTLDMLDSLHVDRDREVVVCATPNEQERYLASLGNGWRTEVASLGLVNAREWYHGHFAEGTRILNIDDDVEAIMVKHGKKVERYEGCIDDIAEDGFSQCEAARARLWGIYPVDNGLFMNDQTVVGLRFICGVFFGSYAGDPVFSHRRGSNTSASGRATCSKLFLVVSLRNWAAWRPDWFTERRSYARYADAIRNWPPHTGSQGMF